MSPTASIAGRVLVVAVGAFARGAPIPGAIAGLVVSPEFDVIGGRATPVLDVAEPLAVVSFVCSELQGLDPDSEVA